MVQARPKPNKGEVSFDRAAFYRLCRMLHAYLSAFAFLALIFFSFTGLLLDHPDWLQGRSREHDLKIMLPASEITSARHAASPGAALAVAVGRRTPLIGAYKSGDVDEGQMNIRLEGVKGASTILVDLTTGEADVSVEQATAVSVIEDLHRGKNAGLAWRGVIDISAIVVLTLSMIGYVLFFSLRFRLRTSLILTAVSLCVLLAVYLWFTP